MFSLLIVASRVHLRFYRRTKSVKKDCFLSIIDKTYHYTYWILVSHSWRAFSKDCVLFCFFWFFLWMELIRQHTEGFPVSVLQSYEFGIEIFHPSPLPSCLIGCDNEQNSQWFSKVKRAPLYIWFLGTLLTKCSSEPTQTDGSSGENLTRESFTSFSITKIRT